MTELEGFYYCCKRKSIILKDFKLLVIIVFPNNHILTLEPDPIRSCAMPHGFLIQRTCLEDTLSAKCYRIKLSVPSKLMKGK